MNEAIVTSKYLASVSTNKTLLIACAREVYLLRKLSWVSLLFVGTGMIRFIDSTKCLIECGNGILDSH